MKLKRLFPLILLISCSATGSHEDDTPMPSLPTEWTSLNPENSCTERHENSLVAISDIIYLVGGRGIKPVESYNPQTNSWTSLKESPIEFSHFQAITYDNELWVIGAFTGPYPHEVPVPSAYIYDPATDMWRVGPSIPEDRRRGAAGAVVHNNRIYLLGGEIDGHWDGTQAWFDEYDPVTNTWKTLPDAPRVRDHISVGVIDNKLIVAGGRETNAKSGNVLNNTIREVDIYDFTTGTWSTLGESGFLPTERAGAAAAVIGNYLYIIGGESASQEPAHSETEALNTETMTWETMDPLNQGRHGTGAALVNNKIYIVAGSGNRGGGPELTSVEVFE